MLGWSSPSKALKLILAGTYASPAEVARFRAEAETGHRGRLRGGLRGAVRLSYTAGRAWGHEDTDVEPERGAVGGRGPGKGHPGGAPGAVPGAGRGRPAGRGGRGVRPLAERRPGQRHGAAPAGGLA